MEFELQKCTEILERTPKVLYAMLAELPDHWILANEGPETWSAFDIVGHLIHGEKTDWMVRLDIVLSDGPNKTFTPFDRFAQFEESKGKSMAMLLDEFAALREQNLQKLASKNLQNDDWNRRALHPALGEVNLVNLLSTWAVHDLGHLAQIDRVMAKQWKTEVGPWVAYLPVLSR